MLMRRTPTTPIPRTPVGDTRAMMGLTKMLPAQVSPLPEVLRIWVSSSCWEIGVVILEARHKTGESYLKYQQKQPTQAHSVKILEACLAPGKCNNLERHHSFD